MSSFVRRSAFRLSYTLILSALVCLILPRALSAMEGALATTDGQTGGAAQAPAISDIGDSAYGPEIEVAVKLGYMSLVGGTTFKPEGKIRAKDFLACVQRGMSQAGLKAASEYKLDDPNAWITRQQAVRILAASVLTRDEIELIGKRCGGFSPYLSDFTDAGDVASWAEPYVAAAVYRGWIPERYRLYPKEEATREFAAALLTRAFPDYTAYTGLAVYVCAPKFKRSMSVQILCGDEAVYPVQDGMPSIAFSGSPGIASYCSSLEEAKERRVGYNPLPVSALGVQRGKRGELQIVLSPDEAQRIMAANRQGLFLKTWRVAIIEVPPGVRTALETSDPGPSR